MEMFETLPPLRLYYVVKTTLCNPEPARNQLPNVGEEEKEKEIGVET